MLKTSSRGFIMLVLAVMLGAILQASCVFIPKRGVSLDQRESWEHYFLWTPQGIYCEAKWSGWQGTRDEFDHKVLETTVEDAVNRWFPVGTPMNEVFNYFTSRGFGVAFRSVDNAESDGPIIDASERYVRFEGWVAKNLGWRLHWPGGMFGTNQPAWTPGKPIPLFQVMLYFVFDKDDTAWKSKRIHVAHRFQRNFKASKHLRDCADIIDDAQGDKEKFVFNNRGHIYTEARRLGLHDGREMPSREVRSKTVKHLLQEWFPGEYGPGSVNQDELAAYLKRKGFTLLVSDDEEDEATRFIFTISKFGTYETLVVLREGKIDKVDRMGYFFGYLQGGPRTDMRGRARRLLLHRMAEREGREPFS